MPRVLCTLPHASTSINGVAFSAVPAGMLSVEDLPDDIAASFASICGYELVTPPPVKPATSPPPAAATVAPNPPAPKAAAAVPKAAPAPVHQVTGGRAQGRPLPGPSRRRPHHRRRLRLRSHLTGQRQYYRNGDASC